MRKPSVEPYVLQSYSRECMIGSPKAVRGGSDTE